MEGGKKPTASSSSSSSPSTGSSISNELFGPKGGSSSSKNNSSTGSFDSVFAHPSTYSRSEVIGSWRKQDSGNQGWNKQDSTGNASQTTGGQGQNTSNRGQSSIFQDERVEPHYLSSSIFYGAQDVYSNQSTTRSSVPAQTYKKDGENDDPDGSASRGNWWQAFDFSFDRIPVLLGLVYQSFWTIGSDNKGLHEGSLYLKIGGGIQWGSIDRFCCGSYFVGSTSEIGVATSEYA
ncbi:hypothetical protein IFM89_018919 [Coptis chinensis]|uniref:Uncharacterized protein n=1 Tax=Coptis chinensis TaxID=261450 RepID=A0A835LJ35_9MAGN|nr:hypothetical protein IFM89_018919 [Coptis chinensis]